MSWGYSVHPATGEDRSGVLERSTAGGDEGELGALEREAGEPRDSILDRIDEALDSFIIDQGTTRPERNAITVTHQVLESKGAKGDSNIHHYYYREYDERHCRE